MTLMIVDALDEFLVNTHNNGKNELTISGKPMEMVLIDLHTHITTIQNSWMIVKRWTLLDDTWRRY